MTEDAFPDWRGINIVGVHKGGKVMIVGDGQISLGHTVIKSNACKVRRLSPVAQDVICGFAVSTANACTPLERLDSKLEASPGQFARADVNLAKDWCTEKYRQKLEAMLIVNDGKDLFLITGAGDALTPKHDIAVRGSGGNSALAGGGVMMTNGNLSVERIDG